MSEALTESDPLELATELTVAWLANPNTRASADEVPAFLARLHAALNSLSSPERQAEAPSSEPATPAVSVRKSLASPEHIISLIDGKPYKTLRRHLTRHGLTPEQYRERFGLKPDYPMTSQNYSQVRRAMAQKIGLGRKPREPGSGGQGRGKRPSSAKKGAPAAE